MLKHKTVTTGSWSRESFNLSYSTDSGLPFQLTYKIGQSYFCLSIESLRNLRDLIDEALDDLDSQN